MCRRGPTRLLQGHERGLPRLRPLLLAGGVVHAQPGHRGLPRRPAAADAADADADADAANAAAAASAASCPGTRR